MGDVEVAVEGVGMDAMSLGSGVSECFEVAKGVSVSAGGENGYS